MIHILSNLYIVDSTKVQQGGFIVAYDLTAMKEVDIRTVDPATLIDIRNVIIDPNRPPEEKAIAYLSQIGNAYCFKCGDVIVKIRHADTSKSIDDCMEGFLRSL